jgi:hypothetical protein
MKRYVLAICMALLLISALAWAVPSRSEGGIQPQWWPGEGPGAGAAANNAAGRVAAVSPTSITLDTVKNGQRTFAVTADTRIMVRGQRSTIDAVKVGDPAVVKFLVASDKSLVARGIMIAKPSVGGKITAVSDGAMTLQGKDGKTWNVTFTPNTKIVCRRYVGSAADLKVGYIAMVQGEINGDTVQANAIEFTPTVIKGVIQSVSGNTITVMTIRQKTVNVAVTDATFVLVRPRTAPNRQGTLADLRPNMPVNIGGHITGEAAMTAIWVEVLTAGPDGGQGGSAVPGAKRGIRPNAGIDANRIRTR